jgi:hypothetical protein
MGSCALASCLVLQGIGRKTRTLVRRESIEVFVEDRENYALSITR